MATTTCATISHTHGHGLPSKPHTDSPLLSFTNLPVFNSKHHALTTFKSFHVKLKAPLETSIMPVNDKDGAIEAAEDRVPRMISSRARRTQGISTLSTQSPHRRGQVKSPSPPAVESRDSPVNGSPVMKPATAPSSSSSSSSKPVASARPVLTATIPVVPKVSKAAASATAPLSYTFTPAEIVHRYIQDEWGPYELGQVRGPPTRGHWRPDETASCCAYPTCTVVFSLLNRRHHCRRCGDIYCKSHSLNNVPLDHEARLHAEGNHERACMNCFADYQVWQQLHKSRTSSIVSATATKPHIITPTSGSAANSTPITPVAMYPDWQVNKPPGMSVGLNPLLNRSSGSAPTASTSRPESEAYIDLNWSTF